LQNRLDIFRAKEIVFTILFALFIFFGLSSIYPESQSVGSVGSYIGNGIREYFGYLGLVLPFSLIVPLFFLYLDLKITIRRVEIFIGSILFLFASLMFQSKLDFEKLSGKIGDLINQSLTQSIGNFGSWMAILLLFVLSILILVDIKIIKNSITNTFKIFISSFNYIIDTFSKPPSYKSEKKSDLSPKKHNSIDFNNTSGKIYELKNNQNLKELDGADTPVPVQTQTLDEGSQKEVKADETEETKEKKELKEFSPESLNKAIQKEAGFVEKDEKVIESESRKADTPRPANKKRVIEDVVEDNQKLLDEIEKGGMKRAQDFRLPPLDFLKIAPKKSFEINENEIDEKIGDLLTKLSKFKIDGDVVRTYAGPIVTTFEFKPAPHIKVSKILNLQDDLAMALKAETIRIQAPIPGKDVVGIEIPNRKKETIYLREVLESDIFKEASSPLTIALGKDIVGNAFVTDLKKLPHLLIAGTTGSGKSVGINAMLMSLLYRNSPKELKLLMIDPKMLEFSIYNDIPHLITPVITQSKLAINALANLVNEMERRYKMMSLTKTKNIENYNQKAKSEGEEEFPYIVVIIDELSDLMMVSGKDVEFYITRLAQMARASGIHLIVATQRPSVNVVTGIIKANLPSRISYKVGQKIDSKVILDTTGAESLLGKGDMLFTPPNMPGIIRLHAPFVEEDEIIKVVEYLKSQQEVEYDESYLSDPNDTVSEGDSSSNDSSSVGELDELYEEAKKIVLNEKKTSISYIQRRLQIGYNRSARIIEQLEQMGVISSPNHKGQREIL
jgi:S-DNA-T family DNA segregation ATPase FtsK/SpoIIIE